MSYSFLPNCRGGQIVWAKAKTPHLFCVFFAQKVQKPEKNEEILLNSSFSWTKFENHYYLRIKIVNIDYGFLIEKPVSLANYRSISRSIQANDIFQEKPTTERSIIDSLTLQLFFNFLKFYICDVTARFLWEDIDQPRDLNQSLFLKMYIFH